MFNLDYSAICLISVNIIQMVSILLLLLPFINIITLSKYIKQYKDIFKDSPLLRTFTTIYGLIIVGYGILGPTRTLNKWKGPKYIRQGETPQEKLIRVIDSTNAIRNYMLGAFSLFYVLVIWRLCDFVIFSAKLHEFSDLMGNYELIDITIVTEAEKEESESSFIIDETIEDIDSVHWPSIVELSKTEHTRIQSFFKEVPKKTDADHTQQSVDLGSKDISQASSSKTADDKNQERAISETSTGKDDKATSEQNTEGNKKEDKSQQ